MVVEITGVKDFKTVLDYANFKRALITMGIPMYSGLDIGRHLRNRLDETFESVMAKLKNIDYKLGYTPIKKGEFKTPEISYNMIFNAIKRNPSQSIDELVGRLLLYINNPYDPNYTYRVVRTVFDAFPDGLYIYTSQYPSIDSLIKVKY